MQFDLRDRMGMHACVYLQHVAKDLVVAVERDLPEVKSERVGRGGRRQLHRKALPRPGLVGRWCCRQQPHAQPAGIGADTVIIAALLAPGCVRSLSLQAAHVLVKALPRHLIPLLAEPPRFYKSLAGLKVARLRAQREAQVAVAARRSGCDGDGRLRVCLRALHVLLDEPQARALTVDGLVPGRQAEDASKRLLTHGPITLLVALHHLFVSRLTLLVTLGLGLLESLALPRCLLPLP